MRLLYVTSSFPFGPYEAFLSSELAELERLGHELTIVPTFARGVVVHGDAQALLPRTRHARLFSQPVAASALAELRGRPRETGRQLVRLRHSRSAHVLAKNLAVLPKALWLAQVARELNVDHIHAHWAGTSGTIALIASAMTDIPWSLTVHRWDIREDNLLHRKVNEAAFVRAISEDGLRDLRRAVGTTATPTLLLHMGVALPEHLVEPVERRAGEPFRVLVPANLLEVKGHRHLVDALSLLRTRGVPAVIGIAGRGPLRSEIEAQIDRLGLAANCFFLGVVPHPELLAQLEAGSWDAVALPSIPTPSGDKEGIPVALIEAMSHAIPVVGTALGGVPELLRDGAGMLVPPADPNALADALERLATDKTLRAQLGRLGRARIEHEFAATHVARELSALFEQFTADSATPPSESVPPNAARIAPAKSAQP